MKTTLIILGIIVAVLMTLIVIGCTKVAGKCSRQEERGLRE